MANRMCSSTFVPFLHLSLLFCFFLSLSCSPLCVCHLALYVYVGLLWGVSSQLPNEMTIWTKFSNVTSCRKICGTQNNFWGWHVFFAASPVINNFYPRCLYRERKFTCRPVELLINVLQKLIWKVLETIATTTYNFFSSRNTRKIRWNGQKYYK